MTQTALDIRQGITKRRKHCITAMIILSVFVIVLSVLQLLIGNTFYPLPTIIKVLMGDQIKGATYAIMSVRLPRMLAGLFAGAAFGAGGYVFQSMLRNPLASPDMIGITSGSGTAAVLCILVLGISGARASAISIIGGISVTLIIFLLSSLKVFSNGRVILIGIGIQAMLKAVISYVLLKASTYDVPAAMRWLSGSLNGAQMNNMPLTVIIITAVITAIYLCEKSLKILELGDQSAAALGVNVSRVRAFMAVGSVIMLSFAIAVTGPVASVAFLSGPISSRIVGKNNANALAAALVGAVLVLGGDLAGQYALGTRFPVGVVTGILGAPYLIYLLISMSKKR